MPIRTITKTWIAVALAGIFSASCEKVEKDPTAYFPKVATQSAVVQPDGSLLMTGEVTSPGRGDLYFLGFCMDTVPQPQMHIGQVLVDELVGSRFSGLYNNLDKTKRYYVRSFGVNEYGFSYGNDMVVENVGLDTTSIPCHPGTNVARSYDPVNGMTYASELITSHRPLDPLTREFEATGNSIRLRVRFGKRPIGGIYTTVNSGSVRNGSNDVEVYYSRVGTGYELPQGSKVYVWQQDAATIRVWICDAPVNSYINLSANVTVRLQ